MSDESADVEALADSIEKGTDTIAVPEELLHEPEPGKPINKSLYAQIGGMKIGEKIKLALKGNRDARMILIRDANKIIPRFVLQNPRVTDEEVVMVAKNRNIEAEILRRIGEHKSWPRNYQVKLALVTNPKTPLATAMHFANTLMERDLRFLAKSKNISSAVVSHIRRLMLNRERR